MISLFSKIFEKKIKEPDQQPDLEAHYAFRTIITMLSLIRSEKGIHEERVKHGYKELKIVDALAAVIIREHGVGAVVVNPSDGSGTIEVFASVTYPKDQLIIPQPSGGSFLDTCLSFLTAQNPRRKDSKKNPEASSKDPIIIDPARAIPQHLKGIQKPSDLLQAFLENDW